MANTGLLNTYLALGQTIQLEEPVQEGASDGVIHDPKKYDTYWYHPDHLGSSSYISGLKSNVLQHMEYLPFGELLVDEHQNSYNTPYKFNAKELDAETGWYYYGARYYDPKWSIMLSVDQMYDKYPSFSPYAYTLQNPINYTDPTGMTAEPPVNGLDWFADDTGEYFWNEGKDKYEHYSPDDASFQGYYSADKFSEPAGDYSIIFDLSNMASDDEYDPSKTIWSVAAPMLAGLEEMSAITFSEVKDISDSENYPGVKIYSSEHMNGAITLGNLIITNPDMEDKDVLDHEYGHYLDYKHHFKYNQTQY